MLTPRLSALALVALAVLGARADAQASRPQIIPYPVNPNQYVAPNMTARQVAYNAAVLGAAARQIPPYLYGYNPYPPTIINQGAMAPGIAAPLAATNPYMLSTTPLGTSLAGTGSLSTSPYSLSTVPGGDVGSRFTPFYNPSAYWQVQDPYSATVQGLASLTAATGQYYINVQQARLLREQSRQASLETARKRLELEAWYESIRPTAPKMAAKEQASSLEMARRFANATDITSGKALNTLLNNLPVTGLNKGDNVAIDEETLKGITLSGGTSGNVGLLKSLSEPGGKLVWPTALQEASYDEPRKRISRDLQNAVITLKDKDDIKPELLRSIRQDYKTMAEKLSDSADDLDAGQYIAAKRYLNQMKSSIEALGDPKAKNYFDKTWTAKGKSVAELVANMKKEGLTFAPAAPGDEAAYNALYYALRAFEASMEQPKQ